MSAALFTGTAYVQLGDLAIIPGQIVDGVLWELEPVVGWDNPPSVTSRVQQRNADHGGWLQAGYLEPETYELRGYFLGRSWSALAQSWATLKAALPSFESVTLTVAGAGSPVLQASVVQGEAPILTQDPGKWNFSLSLLAVDPRRYDTDETTDSTGLPITTGGLSLPITLPLSIGATTTSGSITVTNEGDMPTRPVFTITGPCPAGASITHGSARRLYVPESVAAGHSLVIDTDTRVGLLDGVALRVVTGTWFEFDPGVNTVQFSAPTYDASALLSVAFRSAWR